MYLQNCSNGIPVFKLEWDQNVGLTISKSSMGTAASVPQSIEAARSEGYSEEQIAAYMQKAAATTPDGPPTPETDAKAEDEAALDDATDEELPVLIVVAPGVKVSKAGAVTPTADSKLGMLHTALLEYLLNPTPGRGKTVARWEWRKAPGLRWNLMLSEAQGQSIPWKKIGAIAGDWHQRGGTAPLVNFSRGFQLLCRKAMMVTTLRRHALARPSAEVNDWLPPSFLFYPAKPEKSERGAFLAHFAARAAAQAAEAAASGRPAGRNTWILKPSDGGKGERIKIIPGDLLASPPVEVCSSGGRGDGSAVAATEAAASPEATTPEATTPDAAAAEPPVPAGAAPILAFLEGQKAGSIAWVASEYLERPLLLPGRRKFDWR